MQSIALVVHDANPEPTEPTRAERWTEHVIRLARDLDAARDTVDARRILFTLQRAASTAIEASCTETPQTANPQARRALPARKLRALPAPKGAAL